MKKGYFFTIDAVIGIFILLIGLILISAYYFYSPEKEVTSYLTADITGLLSNVQIKDLCTDTSGPCTCSYPSLEAHDVCRYLDNEEMSLMDLFGLLYHKNRRSHIEEIVNDTLIDNGIVPENFDIQIMIEELDTLKIEQLYPLIEIP